jgi:hypothetical protein
MFGTTKAWDFFTWEEAQEKFKLILTKTRDWAMLLD